MKRHSFIVLSITLLALSACSKPSDPLTAPKLTNNPSLDVILTNDHPLFSFFNANGGNND